MMDIIEVAWGDKEYVADRVRLLLRLTPDEIEALREAVQECDGGCGWRDKYGHLPKSPEMTADRAHMLAILEQIVNGRARIVTRTRVERITE